MGCGIQNNSILHETITFDDIPTKSYDHHSGTFIPPGPAPSKLKCLIEDATLLLMPNNLIGRIRDCKSVAEFDALMSDNEMCFDTFHYGIEVGKVVIGRDVCGQGFTHGNGFPYGMVAY